MGFYGNEIINENNEELLKEFANKSGRKEILKKICKAGAEYVKRLGLKGKIAPTFDDKDREFNPFIAGDKNSITLSVNQNFFEFEKENKTLNKMGYTPENINLYSHRRRMINNFKPSELEKIVKDKYDIDIKATDINKDMFFKVTVKEDSIKEAVNDILNEISQEDLDANQKLVPIFVILTYMKHWLDTAIATYTKSPYSHAAISFDPHLRTIYEFGWDDDYNGFGIENLDRWSKHGFTSLKVMCLMVPPYVKRKCQAAVKMYRDNRDQTSFSVRGLFRFLVGKRIDDANSMKMFCSQFVTKVLAAGNINISGNEGSNYTKPSDLGTFKGGNTYHLVYEGPIDKFDGDKVVEYIEKLKITTPHVKLSAFKPDPIVTATKESADCFDILEFYRAAERNENAVLYNNDFYSPNIEVN